MKSNKDFKNKITLKSYHNELKLRQLNFIEAIAKECNVTKRTVYNWISGKYPVPALCQEKINNLLKCELYYE
jgi:hypothetical protein